jgi:hypothetical protein
MSTVLFRDRYPKIVPRLAVPRRTEFLRDSLNWRNVISVTGPPAVEDIVYVVIDIG